MSKFPVDVPIRDVIKALERLGFQLVRSGLLKVRPSVPSSVNREYQEMNS